MKLFGERTLASATTRDGRVVAGTRDALIIDSARLGWESLQSADWDPETDTLRVAEVGTWGESRPVHELQFDDPGRLLELIRERITASVVLQRHVPVPGTRGLFVIGRRAPRGDEPVHWVYEFGVDVDPADPSVRQAAGAALRQARDDLGL